MLRCRRHSSHSEKRLLHIFILKNKSKTLEIQINKLIGFILETSDYYFIHNIHWIDRFYSIIIYNLNLHKIIFKINYLIITTSLI